MTPRTASIVETAAACGSTSGTSALILAPYGRVRTGDVQRPAVE
jgi:hypothetical protein